MLALRPPADPLASRGRSRQVASSAMARQASDERRAAQHHAFFIPVAGPEHDADDDEDDEDDDDDDGADAPPPVALAPRRRQIPRTDAPRSHASPSPVLGYHSQRSSFSSIQSALSTPSSSSTMLSIAAPVPLKAPVPPPFVRSASPSPPSSASMSPDYYDSPPSPPRSLEDQVHVAYAREDIRLAKILLLRVKGYDITSDDDPRIDDITEDDFHSFFVPGGRLMDEHDEKVIQELQAREQEAYEQRRRVERLRECGRKWDFEKQRMRDERLAVLRRRERKMREEEDRRQAAKKERERLEEEERLREARRRSGSHHKTPRSRSRKLDYHILQAPVVNPLPKQYVYSFPGGPSRVAKALPPPPPSAQPAQRPAFDDSCSVPFTDVLKSMQGPLFPPSHADRPRRTESPALSRSTSRTHSQPKRRRDARLLEVLLVDIEYTADERRKLKGKQPEHHPRIFAPCLACFTSSSPQSSLASSPPSIRRTSSWLSFRGTLSSSASSSTTDLTTPSSSPIFPSKSPWFIRPKSAIADAVQVPSSMLHSCQQRTRLAPVALSDTPLYVDPLPAPTPTRSEPLSHLGRRRSTSTARAARERASSLVRRMSKFVELAKGIQTAYASAAALLDSDPAGACADDRRPSSPGAGEDRNRTRSAPAPLDEQVPPPRQRGSRPKLRPAGYRASARDVAKLLEPPPEAAASSGGEPGTQGSGAAGSGTSVSSSSGSPPMERYIPLTTPFKATEAPRTVLPDPLPYKLVFKRVLSPSRSPFRFHALSELHTMYPSSAPSPPHMTGQVTWRIRSVGNPVHMRLKALRNVVRQSGVPWEGSGSDTALGGGRERVIGVAYENIGSTQLRRSSSSSSLN